MSDLLHHQDFHEGQVIPLGNYAVTREDIVAFAREFDPQPFHIDETAAARSLLGGLSASGWHSCAILMRMICDSFLSRSASMGSNGLEEVKWIKPVFAGETLHGSATVLQHRVSTKRPEMGILFFRWEVFNLENEKKLEQTGVVFVKVRGP